MIRAKAVSVKEVDSGNDIYGNPIKRIQYEIKQIKVRETVIRLPHWAEQREGWEQGWAPQPPQRRETMWRCPRVSGNAVRPPWSRPKGFEPQVDLVFLIRKCLKSRVDLLGSVDWVTSKMCHLPCDGS